MVLSAGDQLPQALLSLAFCPAGFIIIIVIITIAIIIIIIIRVLRCCGFFPLRSRVDSFHLRQLAENNS